MSRAAIILAMLASSALVIEPAWRISTPAFVWNASASVPIGLYRLVPPDQIEITDLVIVAPPEPLANFLAERGYLPRGVPLLKHVLGIAGDIVCRRGVSITTSGRVVGEAHERDSRGRSLPVWQGCRTLAEGEVFLMNWQSADSLDGRYFGPLPVSSIVAHAIRVWTDDDGDGRFQWHLGRPADTP